MATSCDILLYSSKFVKHDNARYYKISAFGNDPLSPSHIQVETEWGKKGTKSPNKKTFPFQLSEKQTKKKQGGAPLAKARQWCDTKHVSLLRDGYVVDVEVFPDSCWSNERHSSVEERVCDPLDEVPHVMLAKNFEEVFRRKKHDDDILFAPSPTDTKRLQAAHSNSHLLFDFYTMPKLDGVFCMYDMQTGKMFSRSRVQLPSRHEEKFGATFLRCSPGENRPYRWIIGELYKHGVSFQTISGSVRNHKSGIPLQFCVFDVMSEQDSFPTRRTYLEHLFQEKQNSSRPGKDEDVVLVPCNHMIGSLTKSSSPEVISGMLQQLKREHGFFVQEGYEGIMVHVVPKTIHPSSGEVKQTNLVGYQAGIRSAWLLKLKVFQQEEFLCLDICQEKTIRPGETENIAGSILLQDVHRNYPTFHATPKMSVEEKKEIWLNRELYCAQPPSYLATVKFFEYTDDHVPRFPILLGLRHKDDMGATTNEKQ